MPLRIVLKKAYISIITAFIVLFTCFATTYAWIGILSYSSISDFNLSIKSSEFNKDYSLLISADDENYSETVALIDIQKQILRNMYKENTYITDMLDTTDEKQIEKLFNDKAILTPVTTYIKNNNSLDTFFSMPYLNKRKTDMEISNQFFEFDLYLKVEPNDSSKLTDETEIESNLILADIENSLTGVDVSGNLINGNPYLINPSSKYEVLNSIPDTFIINTSSATRFALSIYEPIDVNNKYDNIQLPLETIIYQGGTKIPNIKNGVYSFGGILPEESNIAIQEINELYNVNLKMDDNYSNRENTDKELKVDNQYIYNKNSTNFLGIKNKVQTKMKIKVYFWFEGWDSDCMYIINNKKVTLSLSFAANSENY